MLVGESGAGAGLATIQRSRRCGGIFGLVGVDIGVGSVTTVSGVGRLTAFSGCSS